MVGIIIEGKLKTPDQFDSPIEGVGNHNMIVVLIILKIRPLQYIIGTLIKAIRGTKLIIMY